MEKIETKTGANDQYDKFYAEFLRGDISEEVFEKKYPSLSKKFKNDGVTIQWINSKGSNSPKKNKKKKYCVVCGNELPYRKTAYCNKECKKINTNNVMKNKTVEEKITRRYTISDKKKNRVFSLSNAWIIENIVKPCYYCGRAATGFDRIDNDIGHTEENCVPCCRECNSVRNSIFSSDEMVKIGLFLKKEIYSKWHKEN